MAGLFTKKKKDDGNSNNAKQRPAPPPNGLGLNNATNPNAGFQNNNTGANMGPNDIPQQQPYQQAPPAPPTAQGTPMGPMSPTHPQHSGPGLQQQLQQHQPYSGGPSLNLQAQALPAGGPGAAVPTGAGAAAPPPPPQLFWTQRRILGSNPFPLFQHTSSVTSTGTDIFVYGGSQRGAPKGDLFVIDSASLQCQSVTPAGVDTPMPKSGHTAVNIGQYIIYFGGWDQNTGKCDDSLHVLHTARKEWNRPLIQGTLPAPRHSHSGCSVGTVMYVFGGQVDNFYLGDIVSFDMKTITQNPRWEIIEPQSESPPARSGHCAGVHDGRIYIFGGADADYFYNDIWCFDPRVSTWTPIPASGYLPTGRHGHSCAIVDSVMYVFGGNSPDGTDMNDAYAFKIHERRWYLFQNVGTVASPRSGLTMCAIKDKIFVVGGDSEQGLQDDPSQIYYFEIPKARLPESSQAVPVRQVNSAKLIPNRSGAGSPQPSQQPPADVPSDIDSDRNSGQAHAPGRPDRRDRPARPDRPITQRPASPSTFATGDRQNTNFSISQQTSQLMNPQLGQRPLTTIGATPPPRGISANGVAGQDYQAEGLSIATRRQTLKDGMDNGYGGAIVGMASPVSSPAMNRRTMQHMPPGNATNNGPSASPLRLNNSSDTPAPVNRGAHGGETSPTATRPDRRTMNGISPAAPLSNRKEDEINPYAMDVIAAPPPPTAAGMRQNLPPPPTTPSPPVVAQNTEALGGSIPPPSHPTYRSPSPATGRAYARGTPTPPPQLAAPAGASTGQVDAAAPSPADMARYKQLESKAEEAQEANVRLQELMKEREEELALMRKRENWLVAEVMLARQSTGASSDTQQQAHLNDKRLSMADLEKEIENSHLEGHQLKITKALLKVKEELRNAKMLIATQAQAASLKIKEAERIRTGALQEAAYLKAKLSSLSNAHQDPNGLARVEMDRAADLEKRLTTALSEMEILESQYVKSQELLQQEKQARLSSEERSNGSSVLAEQAQTAHTRALAELASLHGRAAKAEAESREFATRLAESQAGSSGHQSQSSGLIQKITDMKQQVEEHQTALERTQMAYSAANDRAMRAEALCDESSGKLEKLENIRSELSSELNRYKGDTERLQSKVEELESRWQISKDEVITLRKLVEDGLGAFNPRGKSQQAPNERKHDSIAILNTVSKVSELEHELRSLKVLHKNSHTSASKSASELADVMIELSRLEQTSMQARAESISLQRLLADEREGNSELRNELSKTEQELENKIKELENHEVQLGLLKDVMREKGIIAEDMMLHAEVRGSGNYAASMEIKVKQAEGHVQALEQELEETRDQFAQQMETFEAQRQATVQHSEKTGMMLRKLKNDLAATIKEKEMVELDLKQLRDTHAQCSELSASRDGQNRQDDERVQMLQLHWDEERRELATQLSELQNRLMESEMHSTELSQKVISLTERIEEVETLNEAVSEHLESMQEQADTFKSEAAAQEMQLKSDVERLVNEVHQAQDMVQAKQRELEGAFALNGQLETQLNHALQAQAAAASSNGSGASSEAALAAITKQRQDLEQRLKKAQEAIQVLEGDNSVLEARLQDSEKKVALLLEDMQNSFLDASNSNSPPNPTNLSGMHQHRARNLGQSNPTLSSPSSPNPAARSGVSPRSGSGLGSNNTRPLGASPSSPQIHKPTGHSPAYMSGERPYNYGASDDEEEEDDINSRSYRDSVDSITRELEMLKVPWSKATPTGGSGAEGGRKSSSPLQRPYQQTSPQPRQQRQQQQQQQQQQHSENYYGNSTGNGNRRMYSDNDDSDDDGVSYLAHLQPRSSPHQTNNNNGGGNAVGNAGTLDTHSFNDRSPSRLKEYEQMIDEIENARNQH